MVKTLLTLVSLYVCQANGLDYSGTTAGAIFTESSIKGLAYYQGEINNGLSVSSKFLVSEKSYLDSTLGVHKKNYFVRAPYSTRFAFGLYSGPETKGFLPTLSLDGRLSLDGYRSYVELKTQAYSLGDGGDVDYLYSIFIMTPLFTSRTANLRIGLELQNNSKEVGASIGISM